MKGVELPINLLVIITIAVIVLLGLIAMYTLGIGPFTQSVGLEAVKNTACAALQRDGCMYSPSEYSVNFDANGDDFVCTKDTDGFDADTKQCIVGQGNAQTTYPMDNLQILCSKYFNADSEAECKRICGCPGY